MAIVDGDLLPAVLVPCGVAGAGKEGNERGHCVNRNREESNSPVDGEPVDGEQN